MTPVVSPAARKDILRQYRYYLIEKDAEAAAERFLECVQIAIDSIGRQPEIGKPTLLDNPSLSGLRSRPVKDFRVMRIYYLLSGDTFRVIRVLHGKRDITSIVEEDLSEIEDWQV